MVFYIDEFGLEFARAKDSFKKKYSYHNFTHCLETAIRTSAAATFYDLGEEEYKALFLAGLFHDAGYVGSKNDNLNVVIALEEWGRGGLVAELIESTCSPWIEPLLSDTNRLLKLIIRDADILQSTEDAWRVRLEDETGLEASLGWLQENLMTEWGKNYFYKRVSEF